jgi:purine-binding chemotaxis protein CheW
MSGAAPSNPGTWDELARAAASRRDAAEPDAQRQLLCVRVDGTPYAVPVENVREIVRVRSITPIPRTASEVRGVFSLRGEIIQVIDLRRRLGLAPAPSAKTNRIVVVQADDGNVAGVLVDEVREVLRVTESAIGAPAAADAGIVAALCTNGAEFVSIVDPDRLLEVEGRG